MLSKKIFEKEIAICKEQHEKKKSCNWGKCKDCGVVPLLYKLHKGVLIEDKKEIAKLKKLL
ncbi:MAG TPA: hypothetical protein DIT25_03945 [Candidatus Moranbacteria bacterium]|nr:hypothetical protein [Candidatus Moranbacteria bacterium]